MSGHIRQRRRKDGTFAYEARWVDPQDRRERTKTFPTRKLAKAHLIEVQHSLLSGKYVDPRKGRITFAAYASEWVAARTDGDARSRIIDNALRVHIIPVLGSRSLETITRLDVVVLVNRWSERLAPGTVRNIFEVLHAVLESAVYDGKIVKSPAITGGRDRIRLPKASERVDRFLTAEEVRMLVTSSTGQDALMTQFLASTGLRIGEMLGLRVGDIDLRAGAVTVSRQLTQDGLVRTTKSGRSRQVPLGKQLADALRPMLVGRDPESAIWLNESGEPLTYRQWRVRWAKAVAGAGLSWRPATHDLRHFFASNLLSNPMGNVGLAEVSAILGHSSPQITLETYTHAIRQHSDGAQRVIDSAFFLPRTPDGQRGGPEAAPEGKIA